jgi:hypothetical protein
MVPIANQLAAAFKERLKDINISISGDCSPYSWSDPALSCSDFQSALCNVSTLITNKTYTSSKINTVCQSMLDVFGNYDFAQGITYFSSDGDKCQCVISTYKCPDPNNSLIVTIALISVAALALAAPAYVMYRCYNNRQMLSSAEESIRLMLL